MNEIEALVNDVVFAIASSLGAAFAELEVRTKGNFRSPIAADAIRKLADKVPANAANRETVVAVYNTFAAVLNGKPAEAPEIRLRPASPSAKPRKPQPQAKRTE